MYICDDQSGLRPYFTLDLITSTVFNWRPHSGNRGSICVYYKVSKHAVGLTQNPLQVTQRLLLPVNKVTAVCSSPLIAVHHSSLSSTGKWPLCVVHHPSLSSTDKWPLCAVHPVHHPSLFSTDINPLNADLNPICQLLTLLEAHHILHDSRIRVKNVWSHISTLYITSLHAQGTTLPSSTLWNQVYWIIRYEGRSSAVLRKLHSNKLHNMYKLLLGDIVKCLKDSTLSSCFWSKLW
jgi:hypothetical protein